MLQMQNRGWGLSCRKSLVSVPKAAPLASQQRARRPQLVVSRFRQNGGDTTTQEAPSTGSSSATLVPVVFELTKHCPFGHAFALVGDDPHLGEWDVSKALRLEWSEGDVWCGRAHVPLDTPVSLKYIQVDGGGSLVSWGQDIAGGSNISLMVSPSEEVLSGLALTLDPPEAANASKPPSLVVRLDTAAILPESAAAFKEAALQQAQQQQQQQQAAEADSQPLSDDTTVDPVYTDTTDGSAVWADAAVQLGFGGDESSPSSSEDIEDMWALAAEPSAEHEEQEEGQQEGQQGLWAGEGDGMSLGWEQQEQQQMPQGWGGDDFVYGQHSGDEGPEVTSEYVQDQGLWAEDHGGEGSSDTDPLAAAAGGGEQGTEQPAAAAAGVSAGGLAAGYEDFGSLGAAVEGGLMEAGDDETAAGFSGDAATAGAIEPTADPISNSSGSLQSHMITSKDFEDSEADDIIDNSNDIIDNSNDIIDNSIIDSTPHELGTEQLLAVTAQESARMASTHVAGEGDDATSTGAADAVTTTGSTVAASAGDSGGSRGALEGLPTPPDSNAAAVGREMLGANLPESNAATAETEMLGARDVIVPDAAACTPPNPFSKIIAASPSYSTVDEHTPMPADRKAITEVDASSSGFQPVDIYEDAFGALAAAAAAAAASQSIDSGHQHGREGAAQAAADREVQLVRAEGGDGEGTGTWEGGAAAASEPAVSTGSGGGGAGAGGVGPVDGEGTGTWTAEAADGVGAAGNSNEGDRGRGSEEAASAASRAGSGGGKQQNWFQRLFGGGGNQDDRA